jgi:hypothetical protein
VAIKTQRDKEAEKRTHLHLTPGRTAKWRNMALTTTAISTAPLPILDRVFVRSEELKQVALMERDWVRPKVKCRTREEARRFTACQLDRDICTCQYGDKDEDPKCECTDDGYDQVMEIDRLLPRQAQPYTLLPTRQLSVTAEIPYSPITMQLTLQGLKLTQVVDNQTCTIEPAKLEGCYSCISGASLELKCTTSHQLPTLAHVLCDEITFSVQCGVEKKQTQRINLAAPLIKQACRVKCPGGETSFLLEGELYFVPLAGTRWRQATTGEGEYYAGNAFNLLDPGTWKLIAWSLIDWRYIAVVTVGSALTAVIGWKIWSTCSPAGIAINMARGMVKRE